MLHKTDCVGQGEEGSDPFGVHNKTGNRSFGDRAYEPIFRIVFNAFVLVRLLGGAEIDRMPHVFRVCKDGLDTLSVPIIRPGFINQILVCSSSMLGKIIGR